MTVHYQNDISVSDKRASPVKQMLSETTTGME